MRRKNGDVMEKKRKPYKIILIIALVISFLPLMITLVWSIAAMFNGISFFTSTAYGWTAFLFIWTLFLYYFWPVFIAAFLIRQICIILLITLSVRNRKRNTAVTADKVPVADAGGSIIKAIPHK